MDEEHRAGGPHLSEYDRTKLKAHREVAEPMMLDGLPLTIVMPGLVYGPGDTGAMRDTLLQYLRRRLPMLPRNTTYCWGHVDDTADAHLRAMEQGQPGESYIIAGPVHTFVEAFEIAERITGIPAPRQRVAPGVLRMAAAMMGIVDAVRPVVGSYTPESARVVAGVTYIASSAKARRELGFAPARSMQGYARRCITRCARWGSSRARTDATSMAHATERRGTRRRRGSSSSSLHSDRGGVMTIALQLEPADAGLPPVEYRWDADTDILSARLRQRRQPADRPRPASGAAGETVELSGPDGSWLMLDLDADQLRGVEIAVWPTLRTRDRLTPPPATTPATVRVSSPPAGGEVCALVVAESDAGARTLHFRVGRAPVACTARLGGDLLVDLDARSRLAGLWLLNVPPAPSNA